jgi:excinuclease ABC subunit C
MNATPTVNSAYARLQSKINQFPHSPGVYLMRDVHRKIFYIGKAKNIQKRVRSYFTGSDQRAFVQILDSLLMDIEVVVTASEKEALILESDLIRHHHPRFNVKLTDDKRYVCLKIDLRQPYPRLQWVRKMRPDGARYFGPYHRSRAIRQTLQLLNRYFQLRSCTDTVMKQRRKPCLLYQLKRCSAPCVFDLQTTGAYAQQVQHVVAFLEGRQNHVLRELRQHMKQAAQAEHYERAAHLRDQIQAIEKSLEKQSLVQAEAGQRDVIGFYREHTSVQLCLMHMSDGQIQDARRFALREQTLPISDILADFANQIYQDTPTIPHEILLPPEMEWAKALAETLSERAQKPVRVYTPKRGPKAKLLDMAMKNAAQAYVDQSRAQEQADQAMQELQTQLQLPALPVVLECCDISHFQGSHIVGSLVRLCRGIPDKTGYRRYRIRSTATQNDTQSIYEVVYRRLRRGLQEQNLPDVLVIDGGKSQLNAAQRAMAKAAVTIPIVGLAKARTAPPAGSHAKVHALRAYERVFLPGQREPVVMPQQSAALFLLVRARDEAHRFALKFHRLLRKKTVPKA